MTETLTISLDDGPTYRASRKLVREVLVVLLGLSVTAAAIYGLYLMITLALLFGICWDQPRPDMCDTATWP